MRPGINLRPTKRPWVNLSSTIRPGVVLPCCITTRGRFVFTGCASHLSYRVTHEDWQLRSSQKMERAHFHRCSLMRVRPGYLRHPCFSAKQPGVNIVPMTWINFLPNDPGSTCTNTGHTTRGQPTNTRYTTRGQLAQTLIPGTSVMRTITSIPCPRVIYAISKVLVKKHIYALKKVPVIRFIYAKKIV